MVSVDSLLSLLMVFPTVLIHLTFLMDQIGRLMLQQLPWQGLVDTIAKV